MCSKRTNPLPFDDDNRQLDRRDESFYRCSKHGPVLPICLEVCLIFSRHIKKSSMVSARFLFAFYLFNYACAWNISLKVVVVFFFLILGCSTTFKEST